MAGTRYVSQTETLLMIVNDAFLIPHWEGERGDSALCSAFEACSLFNYQLWRYALRRGSNNYRSGSHLLSVYLMPGVLAALLFVFSFNLYSNCIK